jgi:hypothetical protein
MSTGQPDLFATPAAPEPPPRPPFDPHRHPCAVCGAKHAPFGFGWPHEPEFYCRQHWEERDDLRRRAIAPDGGRPYFR